MREVDRMTDALAAGLAGLGFQPGDRLAVYLQNVPQFVLAMMATWKAGGIEVSVNPMNKQRELEYLLSDSGATVLVTLSRCTPRRCARWSAPAADRSHRDHHQRARLSAASRRRCSAGRASATGGRRRLRSG